MPEFKFQARSRAGEEVAGSIAAKSRSAAGRKLNGKDLFVAHLAPADREGGAPRARPHASTADVAWQMWQLSVMVDTGVGLADALDCLARQAARPGVKALFEQVAGKVRDGASLSEAMARFPDSFPSSLVVLIRASEMSGTVGMMLRRSSRYLMNDLDVVRRVRGAAAYPCVMLVLCFAVTIFLLAFVMPQFAGIFAAHGARLPAPTRALLALSNGMLSHWHIWLGVGAVALPSIYLWARSRSGARQINYMLITLPVVSGVMNALYQGRSFRTMAVLLEAHVSLNEAVKVIRDLVPNEYYQELWNDVSEQIHVGESFADPFMACPFIPEPVAQVIANGDRTGKLGSAFEHLAEFTEEEYTRSIVSMTKLLEPLMIVLMGGIVAFVAVSLLLPLFQAGQVMSH